MGPGKLEQVEENGTAETQKQGLDQSGSCQHWALEHYPSQELVIW